MAVSLPVILILLVLVSVIFFAGFLCGRSRRVQLHFSRKERKPRRLEYEKEVFDNLTEYFARDEPYLNSSLSIHDVARTLCTNRTYVSEAVNRFAGTTFPAFVNSYRISRAIDLFRHNPDMKVSEMALRCGFNSPAAFNAQFKLVMNMSPGQWFKKNRSKIKQLRRTSSGSIL